MLKPVTTYRIQSCGTKSAGRRPWLQVCLCPRFQEPSGLDLQSLDVPEGNRVDGMYGLVTEVTERVRRLREGYRGYGNMRR